MSKFSFSVSFPKHITQSTCLSDLELIKDQIPAESLASIREHLPKYANEKDLSTLSQSEIQKLSEILEKFAQFFYDDANKSVQYTEASILCLELIGSVPFVNYENIFFGYWELEQIEKAIPWAEKLFDVEKKIKQSNPGVSLPPVFDIVRAKILQNEGNLDEALKFYGKANAKGTLSFTQSLGYQQIADIYFQKGQIEEAIATSQKALEVLDPNTDNTLPYWNQYFDVARLLLIYGQFQEALIYATKLLNLVKEKSPTSYDVLAKATCQFALTLENQNDFKNSLANQEIALDYYNKANMKDLSVLADIYKGIARVEHELNNLPKAFEAFEKAKEADTLAYGSESPEIGELVADWGIILERKEYTRKESKKYLEEGLSILQKQTPKNNEKIKDILGLLKKF